MSESLNHKLFFTLNRQVGKSKFMDMFMLFCAKYLLFVLFSFGVWYAYSIDSLSRSFLFGYATVMFTVGILMSWTGAYLWKHRRPIVEFPDIKRLLKTLGTWKSFPSDHTFMAMLIPLLFWAFGASWFLVGIAFALALMIGFSRVYVGAHYPRDILGGIVLACIVFFSIIYSLDLSFLI